MTGLKTTDGADICTRENAMGRLDDNSASNGADFFVSQSGGQETGLASCADITVFGGNRGGGKANTYNTKIATPSGWRKMGDLEVGDAICTPYEGIQTVSAIYEQGKQTVYVFYFDDGTMLHCTKDHRFLARVGQSGEFCEMSARDIMSQYVIDRPFPLSLRKTGGQYVEIPLCGEVEIDEGLTPDKLPLHPYLLGYISGSGYWHFERSGVAMSGNYTENQKARALGYRVNQNRKNGIWYLRGITDENRRRITASRQKQLAWIPDEYKRASIKSRWDYLRGIMHKSGRKQNLHPCLDLPNKRLIEDVAEVARSLGIWARVSQIEDAPEKIGYWRVSFVAPDDSELFDLVYYARICNKNAIKPKSAPKNDGVLVKRILQVRKDNKRKYECRCITVTGKDHLYMTEAYTVNHNTVTMLMEPLYDIGNKHFNGIIFRKNKDDFENIINESKRWFSSMGKYNKSKDDMTWYFATGAKLGLSIYDMPMADFDTKYRGQQFAYIGIDELPQMSFEMFKFLMTSNRNTVGVRSRILGTCNPDPLSWLRKFIDWWIGKSDTIYSDGKKHPERKGLAIPERNGIVRYCYMPDDTVDNIVWGNTPNEVYEQCKEMIDDAWDPEWEKYGYTKTSFFVKSVTFIKASLKDNKALLKSDPAYIANLLNQPPEVRAREFEGNWDIVKAGNDMIQGYHLDAVFNNSKMTDDGVRRATCDVAGTGGDNCVTWLWVGWHVADVFVCRRDPYSTTEMLRGKLHEWGVLEENFAYDLNGMGQVLRGAFPRAIPFNNQEAVEKKDKGLYDNKKSQCAYKFAERTQQCGWSIEHSLLDRFYSIGKDKVKLSAILQRERRCIKQDTTKEDKGWCLIHKEQMKHKSVVGHSPDFFEALFMREIFDIKKVHAEVPNWAKSSHKFVHRRLQLRR